MFEVHDSLQRAIQSPASSHFLSLRLIFSSLHAKILHDRLLPCAEQGGTAWVTVPTLRRWLGCTSKTYDEFKYVRRNVLEPALLQINTLSSLSVELDTRHAPGTKKVAEVRFRVWAESPRADSLAPMLALKAQYDILSGEIGLSTAQFNEIISLRHEWTDARIDQALAYTRFSLRRGMVARSVSGFFMKALREGYNVGSADLALLDGAAPPGVPADVKDTAARHRARQEADEARRVEELTQRGMVLFDALDAHGRQKALADFGLTLTGRTIARQHKVAVQALGTLVGDNPWMRRALGAFMAG